MDHPRKKQKRGAKFFQRSGRGHAAALRPPRDIKMNASEPNGRSEKLMRIDRDQGYNHRTSTKFNSFRKRDHALRDNNVSMQAYRKRNLDTSEQTYTLYAREEGSVGESTHKYDKPAHAFSREDRGISEGVHDQDEPAHAENADDRGASESTHKCGETVLDTRSANRGTSEGPHRCNEPKHCRKEDRGKFETMHDHHGVTRDNSWEMDPPLMQTVHGVEYVKDYDYSMQMYPYPPWHNALHDQPRFPNVRPPRGSVYSVYRHPRPTFVPDDVPNYNSTWLDFSIPPPFTRDTSHDIQHHHLQTHAQTSSSSDQMHPNDTAGISHQKTPRIRTQSSSSSGHCQPDASMKSPKRKKSPSPKRSDSLAVSAKAGQIIDDILKKKTVGDSGTHEQLPKPLKHLQSSSSKTCSKVSTVKRCGQSMIGRGKNCSPEGRHTTPLRQKRQLCVAAKASATQSLSAHESITAWPEDMNDRSLCSLPSSSFVTSISSNITKGASGVDSQTSTLANSDKQLITASSCSTASNQRTKALDSTSLLALVNAPKSRGARSKLADIVKDYRNQQRLSSRPKLSLASASECELVSEEGGDTILLDDLPDDVRQQLLQLLNEEGCGDLEMMDNQILLDAADVPEAVEIQGSPIKEGLDLLHTVKHTELPSPGGSTKTVCTAGIQNMRYQRDEWNDNTLELSRDIAGVQEECFSGDFIESPFINSSTIVTEATSMDVCQYDGISFPQSENPSTISPVSTDVVTTTSYGNDVPPFVIMPREDSFDDTTFCRDTVINDSTSTGTVALSRYDDTYMDVVPEVCAPAHSLGRTAATAMGLTSHFYPIPLSGETVSSTVSMELGSAITHEPNNINQLIQEIDNEIMDTNSENSRIALVIAPECKTGTIASPEYVSECPRPDSANALTPESNCDIPSLQNRNTSEMLSSSEVLEYSATAYLDPASPNADYVAAARNTGNAVPVARISSAGQRIPTNSWTNQVLSLSRKEEQVCAALQKNSTRIERLEAELQHIRQQLYEQLAIRQQLMMLEDDTRRRRVHLLGVVAKQVTDSHIPVGKSPPPRRLARSPSTELESIVTPITVAPLKDCLSHSNSPQHIQIVQPHTESSSLTSAKDEIPNLGCVRSLTKEQQIILKENSKNEGVKHSLQKTIAGSKVVELRKKPENSARPLTKLYKKHAHESTKNRMNPGAFPSNNKPQRKKSAARPTKPFASDSHTHVTVANEEIVDSPTDEATGARNDLGDIRRTCHSQNNDVIPIKSPDLTGGTDNCKSPSVIVTNITDGDVQDSSALSTEDGWELLPLSPSTQLDICCEEPHGSTEQA